MSIRHAILGVLHEKAMHGYEVGSALERRIAGGRYNSAQIYQGLHALAERGLVDAAPLEPGLSRDRRPFTITPNGRREFLRWLRTPVVLSRPPRDDSLVKLVFLGLHAPEQLYSFLERLRRQHLRRIGGSQAKKLPTGPVTRLDEGVLSDLTATALRFREEAELQWIDHCLLRLRPLVERQAAQAAAEPGQQQPQDKLVNRQGS